MKGNYATGREFLGKRSAKNVARTCSRVDFHGQSTANPRFPLHHRRAIRIIRWRLRGTGIRGNSEVTGVLKFLLGFYETSSLLRE